MIKYLLLIFTGIIVIIAYNIYIAKDDKIIIQSVSKTSIGNIKLDNIADKNSIKPKETKELNDISTIQEQGISIKNLRYNPDINKTSDVPLFRKEMLEIEKGMKVTVTDPEVGKKYAEDIPILTDGSSYQANVNKTDDKQLTNLQIADIEANMVIHVPNSQNKPIHDDLAELVNSQNL